MLGDRELLSTTSGVTQSFVLYGYVSHRLVCPSSRVSFVAGITRTIILRHGMQTAKHIARCRRGDELMGSRKVSLSKKRTTRSTLKAVLVVKVYDRMLVAGTG